MLASRGVRWPGYVLGIGRRRAAGPQPMTRPFSQFSSAQTERVNHCHPLRDLGSYSLSRPKISPIALRAIPILSRRCQSTSASVTETPLPTSVLASDTITSIDPSTESILAIPEQIGYLKSLGLDYGWGPTAVVEWLLEHIHVFGGTPWWLSIALTTIAFRVLMFKPYMGAADTSARMAAVKPLTTPITEKMTKASKAGDHTAAMAGRAELQRIHAKAGIKTWKAFAPMIQVFFGYGTWRLMKGMAGLPVPGLETGGFGWIQDLAAPDPLYLLPLGVGFFFHLTVKRGGETGATTLGPNMIRFMKWVLPVVSVWFMSVLPAGLTLTFFINAFLGFMQSLLFRSPSFRSWAKMTPLPATTSPTPTSKTATVQNSAALEMSKKINVFQPVEESVTRPKKRKGVLGGALDEISGMGHELEKTVKKYTSSVSDGKRAVGDSQAKRFERRRQRELQLQQADQADRKYAKWRQKKYGSDQE
ncbi:MAG: hypothetical protein M1825_005943 [Sarcosagium campestre]|nr:MAG: hypothetical protein M1825_005943 [Sarcosagium campestre]